MSDKPEKPEIFGQEIIVRPEPSVRNLGGFKPRDLTPLELIPWFALAKQLGELREKAKAEKPEEAPKEKPKRKRKSK